MNRQTNRAFGLTAFVILVAIAAINWWLTAKMLISVGIAAGFFLITALLWPGVLLPFNWIWTRLSGLVAVVNNYVILGLFYFGIIWPIGAVMRFFGKDPMARRFNAKVQSYFVPVFRQADATTFSDLF